MSAKPEAELKYSLDRKEYNKLLSSFEPSRIKVIQQLNTFFDDEDFSLRKNDCALRTRIIDGNKAELTAKLKARDPKKNEPENFKIRIEHDAKITLELAQNLATGKQKIYELDLYPIEFLKEKLGKDALKKVKALGSLSTRRNMVKVEEGLVFEIDHVEVFDHHHYELEVETEDPKWADKKVKEYLKKLDIESKPRSRSKLAQFMKHYEERKK